MLFPIDLVKLLLRRSVLRAHKKTLPNIPTMVIPGLGASDLELSILRYYLSYAGLKVYKGGIGRNHGDIKTLLPLAEQQLDRIYMKQRHPVLLIGWSLGGIIARELSRKYDEKVAAVCCMGSPIVGGGKYTAFARFYKRSGFDLDLMEEQCNLREKRPLKHPSLSLYSKKDGIVFWGASQDPFNAHTKCIEVDTRHFSMGFSTTVYTALHHWLQRTLPANPSVDQNGHS
ncbi:MAG: alpha/beta hydrolase [Myxococcota bacterium]|nr:alpha/beta hydrolase [Myxococcota bacterium]